MIGQKRFGRKIPLPSTMEIKRDLILMGEADVIINKLGNESIGNEEIAAVISRLVDEHHISSDRAQMLINRSKKALATGS